MYLTHALILNSGPLESLEVKPEFNQDGSPKPLVLVGANGSGKTNFLSIITDGLLEIASKHFTDILPTIGMEHKYYRVVGGLTTKLGATYELSALKFQDKQHQYFYRSKTGKILPTTLSVQMTDFAPVANWSEDGNAKDTHGPEDQIERIFRTGAYVSFPSDRSETPHWLNSNKTDDEIQVSFSSTYTNRLCKPIVIHTAISDTKPWIIDVILDQSIDAIRVLNSQDIAPLKNYASNLGVNLTSFLNINKVIAAILKTDARIFRTGRASGKRKLQILDGQFHQLIPDLDALSAGQSTLFSIFATILRYGDVGQYSVPDYIIEGIAVIDEIDAHCNCSP